MISKIKPKSEFARNVLTLMTGTTIAQAIPIVVSPILTRLYTPEDFGVFALYVSILSLIGIVITGRYEIAIILPKKDSKAINVVALCFLITVVISLFVFIGIVLFKNEILELTNGNLLGNSIYLLPLALVCTGIYQSISMLVNRNKHYKKLSYVRVVDSLSNNMTNLFFGYLNISLGMIFGNLIAKAISVFILLKYFIISNGSLIKYISYSRIFQVMKEYREFPLVNSIHSFSDVLRVSLTTILISSYFGAQILGFYALSIRILQTPISILGSSIGQVLYQKFNEKVNCNEPIGYLFYKMILFLIFFGAIFFTFLYLYSFEIFSFIFGEQWEELALYIKVLVPYLFITFVVSPISQIPIILKKQKTFLYINLLNNAIMPLFLFVFHNDFEPLVLIEYSVFFMVSIQIFSLLWIMWILRKYNIKRNLIAHKKL